MTQLALPEAAEMCVVGHLDDREYATTHRAWTRLEPDDIWVVCASCSKGLKALGWEAEAL